LLTEAGAAPELFSILLFSILKMTNGKRPLRTICNITKRARQDLNPRSSA
jgi:hypothetical protein